MQYLHVPTYDILYYIVLYIYNIFVDITFYADEHHAHVRYNTRTHTTVKERRTAAVGARRNVESCVRRGSRIGMGEGFLRPFYSAADEWARHGGLSLGSAAAAARWAGGRWPNFSHYPAILRPWL